jgi:predicted NUDIX family phosphoesterase
MSASAASTLAVTRGAGRELVLVVPRQRALGRGFWHGLRLGGVDELLRVVADWGEFRPRSEVEHQPEWQQVIPHLVVRDGDRSPSGSAVTSTSPTAGARLPGSLDVTGNGAKRWCASRSSADAQWGY